ncbi:MAG: response regulator [Sphingobacteriia bacterium]|jgi:CheY-like chemotaxis protein
MKILVVDDEQDMENLFLQRFRREIKEGTVDFAFANSGEQALEYMSKNNHEAVLILSDINMPGMSGLQLLEKIKQKYNAPPPIVMMITAYGDTDNYNTAMELGADAFLTKPVDFNLLKEKLHITH